MRVLLLGASRNIGYQVAQRLLARGHTCTLLLRRPEAMESDPAMSPHIREGKAKLVPGDGLVKEDVQRAWDTAAADGTVDIVFSGIGGFPSFSLTKGFVITPGDLTTRSMSILLSIIQASTTPNTRPKIVAVSSNGLDERTHALLPIPLRVFYGYLLKQPHEDKIGLENNLKGAAGWTQNSEGWLPRQNAVIVRPSLLTSGKCVADAKQDAYRVGEELTSAWTVSRADVAHFIVEKVMSNWDKWGGKGWVVSY